MMTLLTQWFIKDYRNITNPSVQKAYIMFCSIVGVIFNTLLFAGKFFAGIFSGSVSITNDSFNNLADAVTTAICCGGLYLAGTGPGEKHLFGHGRYEWLVGFVSALAIFVMGITLAKNSITSIYNPQTIEFKPIILFLLILSVFVKFYMFRYNKDVAYKIHSSAIKVIAFDCISDAIVTVTIVVSLIVQQVTGLQTDSWCGLLISAFIMFLGLKGMAEIINKIMGQSSNTELVDTVTAFIMQYPQVKGVNNLIVHDYGMGMYVVSLHIEGDEKDSVILNDIVHDISYRMYRQMNCETTVQVDYLDTNVVLHNLILSIVEQKIQKFEGNATVQSLQVIPSGSCKNISIVIFGSRKLQNNKDQICETLEQSIDLLIKDCRISIKVILAALHPKNKKHVNNEYKYRKEYDNNEK
jgi:cation diffusion facilitator family transporter